MKKLHELLRARNDLLREAGIEKSILPKQATKKPKILKHKLLHGMTTGEITSDNDLLDKLYAGKQPTAATISELKKQTREHILDEFVVNDVSPALRSEIDKAHYRIMRNILAGDTLFVKAKAAEGILAWKAAYDEARKFSFTTEAYLCAKRLVYCYAFRLQRKEQYNMYRNSLTLLSAIQAEMEAAQLYQKFVMNMKDKWFISPAFKSYAVSASKRITQLAQKHATHSLWITHFRSRILSCYTTRDYRSILRTCASYRLYLNKHPHLRQESQWAEIVLHEMNAASCIRRFSYGIRMAEENKIYMRTANQNWIAFQESYFHLIMNAGEFEKAKKLYRAVTGSRQAQNMTTFQKDVWKIFNAYLNIALHDEEKISQLTPVRYFNSLKNCTGDKEGLNFLIQVGLIIYLLVQDNSKENLPEFTENFRQYVSRHIRRGRQYRSYLFSKMLLSLLHYDMDIDKAEAISEKFYVRLCDHSVYRPGDYEMTELIPHERLWKMLLRQLGKK